MFDINDYIWVYIYIYIHEGHLPIHPNIYNLELFEKL